jgi:hypothetical protein
MAIAEIDYLFGPAGTVRVVSLGDVNGDVQTVTCQRADAGDEQDRADAEPQGSALGGRAPADDRAAMRLETDAGVVRTPPADRCVMRARTSRGLPRSRA